MCVPENEEITKEYDDENPTKNRQSKFVNSEKCQNSPYTQNQSHINTNQNLIFFGTFTGNFSKMQLCQSPSTLLKQEQKQQLNNINQDNEHKKKYNQFLIYNNVKTYFMVAFKITDLAKGPIEFFLFGNFALIIFSFDILLCFNVARYEKGILTIDRIEIAKHYLKKEFLFDLISTISILLVILYQSNVYEMPFVIRGFQIKERLAKLDQYFQIKEKFPIIYEISLIIIVILVMAHISGCGFYFIGTYDRYYGDLYPITVNEKFYVIIMTLFSCGIFGYCINRLGSLVSLIQEQSKELESQRKIIKDYLKSRNISHQVQCKFLKNLEYKKKLKYGNDIEAQQLISKQIDPLIQKEFQVEYYGRIIKKTTAFSFSFSQSSINDLSLVAKEQIYTAGDILFNQGQQIDNLYILMKGDLEFSNFENFQENIKINFKMQKEKCISLNGFLAGLHYITSAVFASESRVISISKKDFLKVIKKQDRDYEMYCQMRDRIIFNKSYWQQAETCTSCKTNKSHDSKFCPQLHVKQNKGLILQGQQYRIANRKIIIDAVFKGE
ncbi:Cyclic nucleotide-binding protein [Pseudocohnilembus persalinus]|uniref:Cyclic nucleotide-binding protein n=1 Tax=Pseudocohnilembus persalinus TaxID=266149 RepID=A0A0V0QNP2_PSEPJ|nr:Cyclic nucleotide-binding protein [Pseudocohnilembus persalinus]|eukprot:KRX03799.1 Cyclic nucleotide-binding protein [Pseudocohnilembus persalinus]